KAQVAKMLALAAESLEPVAGSNFAETALWRLMGEPGQKTRQCCAIAAMRGAGAVELDRVLARLRQQARIGSAMDIGFCSREAVENPGRCGRRIDLDTPALGGKHIEGGAELLARHNGHPVPEMPLDPWSELPPVDEQGDAAIPAQDCERQ